MRLEDLGYDEGLPANLAEWLLRIHAVVETVDAEYQARLAVAANPFRGGE